MKNQKVLKLAESAVMLALAFALSTVKLWKMPLGGSVTLVSMLPLMLLAVKNGTAWGIGTAFVYSLMQLVQSVVQGDVFPYCQTAKTVLLCVLFDYILPFTALGLCGMLRRVRCGRFADFGLYAGICLSVLLRFLCHFLTGVIIWGQWAEGMSPYLYSFLYNGTYLGAELALTLAAAALLFSAKPVRRLLLTK